MNRTSLYTAAIVLFTFISLSGQTQFDQENPFALPGDEPVTIRTVMDRNEIAPGDSFRVAVVMDIGSGWHVYANPKGPGTGMDTVVTGEDSQGFRFSPARYMPGEKVSQEDIGPGDWVYAYEGATTVFLDVSTEQDIQPGEYDLSIGVDLLACLTSCQPVQKTETFNIKVKQGAGESTPVNSAIFADYDKSKPAPTTQAIEKDPVSLTDQQQVDEAIDKYTARELQESAVSGVFMAIFLGFIAGILLNFMPCVLPVVSIKIMSLVNQAHGDRSKIVGLGLSFAAGVLVVFLILAGVSAGAGSGWGAHFQSEAFIIIMVSIVFVFALGLFDIYIIFLPGGIGGDAPKEGYVGSFMKGVLATFLATPCSGPFLGATLAWTLSQPALITFSVFTSIGIGMALPYVLLTLMPGLLKFVPKPGPWMETFKSIMGFVLLGTVVYLVSILRRELIGPTLWFCLVLALAAYLWGRYAHIGVSTIKRWSWRIALLSVAALSAFFFFHETEDEEIAWEAFSLERLQTLHLENRTVIIDFTADWCPNCKLVEKFSLGDADVITAIKAKNAAMLKADITRATNDSPSVKFRNHLGSTSIPFLAVFPADAPNDPYVLRDIYSAEDVIEILNRCP